MYYKENVYYSPATHGLRLLHTIDLSEPDYSFDLLAVFQSVENENDYYLATDSGCSCPTPFEDYLDVESLTGPLTYTQMVEEAKSLWRNRGSYQAGSDDLVGFLE